jgi:hypothetical protein
MTHVDCVRVPSEITKNCSAELSHAWNGPLHTHHSLLQLVGVKYSRYHRPLVTVQNSGYDRFPPATNGWRTKYPVPDKAPPL